MAWTEGSVVLTSIGKGVEVRVLARNPSPWTQTDARYEDVDEMESIDPS